MNIANVTSLDELVLLYSKTITFTKICYASCSINDKIMA